MATSAKKIVGRVNGRDVTRGELLNAFNRVANKDNWKSPIDTNLYLTDDEVAMIREAVIFFTGSVPRFTPLSGRWLWYWTSYHVTADGYD